MTKIEQAEKIISESFLKTNKGKTSFTIHTPRGRYNLGLIAALEKLKPLLEE